jgi:hypothetical protein
MKAGIPGEATIKLFWKWYAFGQYSLADICRKADKTGFYSPQKGKRGNKPLSVSALYNLFRNPFYAGLVKSNGQYIKGKHKPMVSQKQFDKVQNLLHRQQKRTIRYNSIPIIFRGLFHCGDCGCTITAEKKCKYSCPKCRLPRTKKSPHQCPRCNYHISAETISKANHYTYYHCTKAKGKCLQKSIREEVLAHHIDQALEKLSINDALLEWCIKWTDHVIHQSLLKQQGQINSMTKKSADL